MCGGAIQAPVSLLLAPDLTASAKLIWLVIRTQGEPTSLNRLSALSGLTRQTIYTSLAKLEAGGWYSRATGAIECTPAGGMVSMPAALLSDSRLRPQAKLLYGLLTTVPAHRNQSVGITYRALSARAGLSDATVRKLVWELATTGWVDARQSNQLAPVQFTLRNPEQERSALEAVLAEQRLQEANFRSEAIMQEFLSLIIDSDEFEENARPGWLINPMTNERMELDRYYPTAVAFEFNGPQHYRTTERFPSEKALSMQKARDLMKEALCARHGVRLIVIHAEDLNLETMRRKVGDTLPLRDLQGHEALIKFLNKVGKC